MANVRCWNFSATKRPSGGGSHLSAPPTYYCCSGAWMFITSSSVHRDGHIKSGPIGPFRRWRSSSFETPIVSRSAGAAVACREDPHKCFVWPSSERTSNTWTIVRVARVTPWNCQEHGSRADSEFACLPAPWTFENFDFDARPSLDRRFIDDLATLRFIEKAANVLFISTREQG
ncbi:MAG: ATP-binding protein [Vicinamibacterales bacterium]